MHGCYVDHLRLECFHARTNEKEMSLQDEEINDTWRQENRLTNFTAGLGFIVKNTTLKMRQQHQGKHVYVFIRHS